MTFCDVASDKDVRGFQRGFSPLAGADNYIECGGNMKALSIRQPWAWLICAGYKDIENKNWPTKFRGRIYVHAGLARDVSAINYARGKVSPDILQDIIAGRYHCGAIIGEVDIVDCVTKSASPWFEGKYGFVLSRPTLYDKPIPYKGKLSFFEVKL